MIRHLLSRSRALAGALLVATWAAACGGGSDGTDAVSDPRAPGGSAGADAGADVSADSGGGFFDASFEAGDEDDASPQGFDVQPSALQTITVPIGQTSPTVAFTATLDGHPVAAGWGIDRGEIGSVTPGAMGTATFAPSGATGGLVTIQAALNGTTLKRQVLVRLVGEQNGADATKPAEQAQLPADVAQLAAGGGVGGVGGEGLGPAVDAATLGALGAPAGDGSAEGLTLLYPYDGTVWPRGLAAPLLMWSWATGDADAVRITLATTSGSFSWTGSFARPAILASTGGPFVRHPIPQDVWDMATNSAGGPTTGGAPDRLTMTLVVARGGQAYGPLSRTWTIAPGRLAGTVYYNSYGTQLVQNSVERSYQNGPQFGAAVLGIKAGDTGPTVVAGTPSPLGSGSGCRVCHTVSADGSRLVVQHGDVYQRTSSYDLKNGNAETTLTGFDDTFGWAALSADGSLAMTNAADLAAGAPKSALFSFPPASSTPLAAAGIPSDLRAGTPAFSPDGKHVAFDFLGGTIGSVTGNGKQLVALDYDAPSTTFSNLRVLATMPAGDSNKRAGFPSFFPTNDAVAFHYQLVASNHRYNTWHGAKAQIWWSDLATGTATPLAALNGLDASGGAPYLPTGPNQHDDDVSLNYEPAVSPVASGGYIWVVFTSRRLYGNLATTDPWQSDPRSYDATKLANTTTKKLWVAAVDLNAAPGTDPSHPAFYLPAQELLAGNARGFWVQDPCRADGQSCESGDQCCNGYCQPGGDGGPLQCSNTPPSGDCSGPQEKCATQADCCNPDDACVNGFCSVVGPH